MRKVICAPKHLIPQQLEVNTKYFSAYLNSGLENVGYFAPDLKKKVEQAGLCPSIAVWDFTTIALSVAAVDISLNRANSVDGWTRQIDLTIHLYEPSVWGSVKKDLENTLRFLTGDFWELTFLDGGIDPPRAKQIKQYDGDCVSLLSGGVDSLVGAIDLVADKHNPLFVSQVVGDDAKTQRKYVQRIKSGDTHFQWSHKIHRPKGESEKSTRGRSIIFFAFAALAASAITRSDDNPVPIYVPENGFISLNIPLNSGRMGSFSTKTTHPVYLAGIQKIWCALGMNMELIAPYQFKTKGELLSECKDQKLLKELIADSTSCGKYLSNGHLHCGRCVPCVVRRAAFLKAGITDNTVKGYRFANLNYAGLTRGPNDVGAMVIACLRIKQFGIQSFISGNLSFAPHSDRKNYEGVVLKGFDEIESLLKENKVL
ncbi:hypothetical protein JCM14076_31490 [Methylosoma difficile]